LVVPRSMPTALGMGFSLQNQGFVKET
jgi:hypothetical protein